MRQAPQNGLDSISRVRKEVALALPDWSGEPLINSLLRGAQRKCPLDQYAGLLRCVYALWVRAMTAVLNCSAFP
jgi:hypothetical protein